MRKYISRGRIEARKCPRKFRNSYLLDGSGYMETSKNLDPLGLGIVVHKGFEVLLRTNDVEAAWDAIENEMVLFRPEKEEDAYLLPQWEELLNLAWALLLGWYRGHHEQFLRDYEILAVEKEIETPLSSNLILLGRPDAILRRKDTGLIEGFNLKTTSQIGDWTSKWLYDIQAWTEALSIEKEIGEKVSAFRYLGLFKGSRRDGHYSSPLIYGYKDIEDPEYPTYHDRYRAKWEKFPAWKESFPFGQGLEKWISWLPLDRVKEQFTLSNPIFINTEIVEEWLSQVVRWETDAQHVSTEGSESDNLAFFEQRFSIYNCKGCPFEDLCFKKADVGDLVKAGRLTPRESPITKIQKEQDILLETSS